MNNPIYVLSIDPGKTTGIVLASCKSPKDFTVISAKDWKWSSRFEIPEYYNLDNPLGLMYSLSNFNGQIPTYVVIESFNLFRHKAQQLTGSDFPAVRVIGMIEYAMSEAGILDRLITQTPSQRIRAKILDQHVQDLKGLHHAKDAYKHLRVFISNPMNKVFE